MQRSGLFPDPAEGRIGILDGGRELMLRGQPVVYGYNEDVRAVRERAAEVVVGIQVPNHPAAAVVVDEDGERRRPGGGVDTYRNLSTRPAKGRVHYGVHRFDRQRKPYVATPDRFGVRIGRDGRHVLQLL
jgi:hypothetical protein